jgi:hypothetical protein
MKTPKASSEILISPDNADAFPTLDDYLELSTDEDDRRSFLEIVDQVSQENLDEFDRTDPTLQPSPPKINNTQKVDTTTQTEPPVKDQTQTMVNPPDPSDISKDLVTAQKRDQDIKVLRNLVQQGRHKQKISDQEMKTLWACRHKDLSSSLLSIRNHLKHFQMKDNILYLESPLPQGEGKGSFLQIVVPTALRTRVMEATHQHATSGHPSAHPMDVIISHRFWWPEMAKSIQQFLSQCDTCPNIKQRMPDVNTPFGNTTSTAHSRLKTWSCYVVSFTVPSGSGQYKHLLTMMDYSTRWLEIFPMRNDNAPMLKKILLDEFLPRYGVGCTFKTDNGPSFASKLFEEACKELDAFRHFTVPFNPKANPVERSHREINTKLRLLLSEGNWEESKWYLLVPKVLQSFRMTPSTVSDLPPYYLVFGQQPQLAVDLILNTDPEKTTTRENPSPENLVMTAQDHALRKIQKRHHENQQQRQKKRNHPFIFQPGTLVNLWRPYDLVRPGQSRRFTRHWTGPYRVVNHDHKKPYRVWIVDAKNKSDKGNKPVHLDHLRIRRPMKVDRSNTKPGDWEPVAPAFQTTMRPFTDADQLNEQAATASIDPKLLDRYNEPNFPTETGKCNLSIEEVMQKYFDAYPSKLDYYTGKDRNKMTYEELLEEYKHAHPTLMDDDDDDSIVTGPLKDPQETPLEDPEELPTDPIAEDHPNPFITDPIEVDQHQDPTPGPSFPNADTPNTDDTIFKQPEVPDLRQVLNNRQRHDSSSSSSTRKSRSPARRGSTTSTYSKRGRSPSDSPDGRTEPPRQRQRHVYVLHKNHRKPHRQSQQRGPTYRDPFEGLPQYALNGSIDDTPDGEIPSSLNPDFLETLKTTELNVPCKLHHCHQR